MDFPTQSSFSVQYNWEQMYNQLLYSYYQLSQNYRAAVNKNLQLEEKFKQKNNLEAQIINFEFQNEGKLCSKKTLPEQNDNLQETIRQEKKQKKNSQRRSKRYMRKRKSHISNNYGCTYEGCTRSYDSSVSLNLHIKLKHNGGTKKQRQTYAKMILDAEQKNMEIPKVNINFPPRFLEDFKTNYEYMKKYSM